MSWFLSRFLSVDSLTDHQKGTEYVRVELPVEFFLGRRL
jgi:hypothetical protein